MRALCARGLDWETICDVQDKLAKEGMRTKMDVLSFPVSRFTHDFLLDLGVSSRHVRQVVVDMRAQATWLGVLLVQCDISNQYIIDCDIVVMECLGCCSKALFAQVLPEELSDAYLISKGIESGVVRRCLRQVHEQVCAEHEHSVDSNRKRPAAGGDTSVSAVEQPVKRACTPTAQQ